MVPIKDGVLDSTTFADAMREVVKVVEIEDLSNSVPHAGFGGASKSSFASTKDGRTIYVLERNGWYGDGYTNYFWLFDQDFSAAEASEFVTAFDAAERERRASATWPQQPQVTASE